MRVLPLILFFATLLASGVGYILSNSIQFGLCAHDQYACRDLFNNIGDPLMWGMSALTLVFLVLLFVPQGWGEWKKFAFWYIPLAALLFIFYPEPGSGDLFSPYPETIYKWASGVYILVSLLIIIFLARKKTA